MEYKDFILADGKHYLFTVYKKFLLSANEDIFDEDWKTALAEKYPIIPKGEQVILESYLTNFYGNFFGVRYKGYLIYAKPEKFNYIKMIKDE